jgi:hypothetical protein
MDAHDEPDDSGRGQAFAKYDRLGPLRYRLLVVARIVRLLAIWFVVGAAVTTVTNFYRGTGTSDYGNRISATAEVGDCRRSGPIGGDGFGYWWECDVTVRPANGGVVRTVVEHSTVTPDDAGRAVPFQVVCSESGDDCRYGRPTAYIWGVLVRLLDMVHVAFNVLLAFVAFMFLIDLVVGPRRYYALYDRLRRVGQAAP